MRRHAVVVLGLVAALCSSALAQSPTSIVLDGCAPGFTLLQSPVRSACVHAAGDLYDARAQAPWVGKAPVTAPPVCYGDGQSGARVQLIYGYVAGQRNRAATVVPQIRGAFAPRMQAVVKAASGGRDLGIRFAYERGCKGLSVPVVAFPASTVRSPVAARQFVAMTSHLDSLGYDRTDRKYQVIWDWWNEAGVCGLGELLPDNDEPAAANLHNGAPSVGHTDVPSAVGAGAAFPTPRYSAVWKNAFGPRGPGCWELDQSGASVQVHELMHTLGAVQLSAPHSDGGGHCTDTPSVMCGGNGGPVTVPACGRQKVQVLDCGLDDFWNPAPAQGSYLATAGNIAQSPFFGPQVQDSAPV